MTSQTHDTIIIGAGQSGLAVSWHLNRLGRSHILLERARIAERWRTERWDSLSFQFPNWTLQLPGFAYDGPDPEGFAGRDQVVDFIDAYARTSHAPVHRGVNVSQLSGSEDGFELQTSAGAMRARNVVLATGPYQKPDIPQALSAGLGDVPQIHAAAYRNPISLPAGAVLVVGSGASGAQIAEDLMKGGRQVYLAVGSHRRAPRRYRGKDFIFWEFALGAFDQTVAERRPGSLPPLLTGGRDMDLSELAGRGLVLTGRMVEARSGKVTFAPDRDESLARAQADYVAFIAACDAHALAEGLELPPPEAPHPLGPLPAQIESLDLAEAGIGAVIWATGYGYDFGWVDLPIFRNNQTRVEPQQVRGVSPVPGLYLVGLPWLSKRKSSLMMGMGEDAAFIAEHLASRR